MLDNFTHISEARQSLHHDAVIEKVVIGVFNYMGLGLLLTAIVAYFTAYTPILANTINAHFGLQLLIMVSPLFIIFHMHSVNLKADSKKRLQVLFFIFCTLMGMSLSWIFAAYTGVAIFKAFAVSSCMFLTMSIYGFSTKKDLTSIGSFMIMGLIGVIITSLINLFMKSAALDYALSLATVAIFMGLTAYDLQRLKRGAFFFGKGVKDKLAIMHALSLYLNFINLFLAVLRLQNR
jgi:hypothetical protein